MRVTRILLACVLLGLSATRSAAEPIEERLEIECSVLRQMVRMGLLPPVSLPLYCRIDETHDPVGLRDPDRWLTVTWTRSSDLGGQHVGLKNVSRDRHEGGRRPSGAVDPAGDAAARLVGRVLAPDLRLSKVKD